MRARIGERVRESRAVAERLLAAIPHARLRPADGGCYAIVALDQSVNEEAVYAVCASHATPRGFRNDSAPDEPKSQHRVANSRLWP